MNEKLSLVVDAKATLGEGPCWDKEAQVLYWVDIDGERVHRYDPKTDRDEYFDVGQKVGAAVVTHTGELLLAMQHGLYRFNMETKKLIFIADPEEHISDNRFNDGKCDPAGRFLAGTMSLIGDEKTGSLYCMEKDFNIGHHFDNVSISNGLGWSPDNKTMYYIDSPTKQVVAFNYDLETGNISNKRVVVTIPEGEGVPDGMTVDEEGMLWVAQWGGYKVSRWNPHTGERIGSVQLPAAHVTSCAFGGENMDELYITTARAGLDDEALAEQPLAGGLFKYKAAVKGVPSFKFGEK